MKTSLGEANDVLTTPMQSKAKQSKATQCKAKHCKAKQSNAEQSKAMQSNKSNAKHSNAIRGKAMQKQRTGNEKQHEATPGARARERGRGKGPRNRPIGVPRWGRFFKQLLNITGTPMPGTPILAYNSQHTNPRVLSAFFPFFLDIYMKNGTLVARSHSLLAFIFTI